VKILALDLGTNMGFASGINQSIKNHGFRDFTRKVDKGSNETAFSNESFSTFFNWLHPLVGHIDILVCEKPNVYGTGKFSSFHAMRVLFGMYGIVQAVAGGYQKPLIPVSATTIKKFWTQDGRADKNKMIVHAARRGYVLKDHNECDAIAIYTYYWEVLHGGLGTNPEDNEDEQPDTDE
jgi:hypothetical protein